MQVKAASKSGANRVTSDGVSRTPRGLLRETPIRLMAPLGATYA